MVWDGQRGGFTDTMEANPEAEAMVLWKILSAKKTWPFLQTTAK